MSVQRICDNCGVILDTVRFHVTDGNSGDEWDTCSAECATALVVRATTMETEMDAAISLLPDPDDFNAIEQVVDEVRERFDAMPPQFPNLSEAVDQLYGVLASR